jgi:hypothetical protein
MGPDVGETCADGAIVKVEKILVPLVGLTPWTLCPPLMASGTV